MLWKKAPKEEGVKEEQETQIDRKQQSLTSPNWWKDRWKGGWREKTKRCVPPLAAGAFAAGAVAAAYLTVGGCAMGVSVQVDGQQLCVASSQMQVWDTMREMQNEISNALGEVYSFDFAPTYEFILAPQSEIADDAELEQCLEDQAQDIRELAVLKVDGKLIGASEDTEAVIDMLMQIKAKYATGAEGEVVEFTNDVSVQTQLCRVSALRSTEQMRAMLETGTPVQEIYQAQEGDTFSIIAPLYNMTITQLEDLNQGVEELHEGDSVVVERIQPLLGVRVTTVEEYDEAVPYEVVETVDDSLYATERVVDVQGVDGLSHVQAQVVRENGYEVARTVLESQVITEPVTEEARVGTRELPPFDGTFSLPVSGVFTSEFGPRWGSLHGGLDIANVMGTAVRASESGTVIFAGEKGTYGQCVMIDHGNGFVTLYGHNSLLEVEVGDQVAKGQEIAKMGSTGRSTGPHCHFEIRVGGVRVNPRLYLDNKLAVEAYIETGEIAEEPLEDEEELLEEETTEEVIENTQPPEESIPEEPSVSEEPEQPAQPVEPAEPAEPAEPVQPTEPEEEQQPESSDTSEPPETSDEMESSEPVETTEPETTEAAHIIQPTET